MKVPPAATTGATATPRIHRAALTAEDVEKLVVPDSPPGNTAVGEAAVDSFEKAVSSRIGAHLGGGRAVWSGSVDATLPALPDPIDTSTAGGSPVEHERATLPRVADEAGDPTKAAPVPGIADEPVDPTGAPAPGVADEPSDPTKAAPVPVAAGTGEHERATIPPLDVPKALGEILVLSDQLLRGPLDGGQLSLADVVAAVDDGFAALAQAVEADYDRRIHKASPEEGKRLEKEAQAVLKGLEGTRGARVAEITKVYTEQAKMHEEGDARVVAPTPLPGESRSFAMRELFLAARTAGKVPWTAATVNRFLEVAMKPADYPAAFADFKGWATTTFLLDATKRAELETISEAGLAQLREGAKVAASLDRPLEFRVRGGSATTDPLRIEIGEITRSERKVEVAAEKRKV